MSGVSFDLSSILGAKRLPELRKSLFQYLQPEGGPHARLRVLTPEFTVGRDDRQVSKIQARMVGGAVA